MSLLRKAENMNQSDAQPSPNYVTVACKHCDGGIEFDADQLDGDKTRIVECPHCHLETIIFVPEHEEAPPVISPTQPTSASGYVDEIIRFYDLGNACLQQKKYNEAVKWLTKAAEQGHAVAQSQLGICYMNGHGVAKDDAEGVKWLRMAAEQGNANAEYSLGAAYFGGRGVPKDFSGALKWWHKAAEHGDATAQYNLSVC
jgi:TPR repeat protein